MLSILTEPKFPKVAIGLEKDRISALALQREGSGAYGVKQAATIEVPPHLLNPNFIERNIASQEEFRVLLEEVVTTAGLLGQKNWSVSLPGSTARSTILTLDHGTTAKGETDDVLDWKAEQSFGVPSGELRITRHKISNDSDGRPRYFATAVKLSVIDEYETVFESLGWKAGLILPRAVSESQWLRGNGQKDSLLLSSQSGGFTALLLRSGEPAVVRSVTCTPEEIDDEIFRLLMFYNDRFSGAESAGSLDRLLVIGSGLVDERIKEISGEALGRTLSIIGPEDVGLNMPGSGLDFDEIAAPAGLAALGFR